MTEAERLARAAIEKTLAACTQAGDSRKADAYAACFTEDGVLELGQKHETRDGIRAFMTAPSVIPKPTAAVTTAAANALGFVSHHLTTCRIDINSDTEATVRTYWVVISAAGLDHSGYYDDRFRKVGENWLIAYRKPRTLYVSPTSVLHNPANS